MSPSKTVYVVYLCLCVFVCVYVYLCVGLYTVSVCIFMYVQIEYIMLEL